MHELPIARSILDIAVRHGTQANARRVVDLYLVIGQLSSFVDDSIQFYWDIISRDTIASGAALHFRRIPAELACSDCHGKYSPDGRQLACPFCGSVQVKIIGGNEFYVEAISVEE